METVRLRAMDQETWEILIEEIRKEEETYVNAMLDGKYIGKPDQYAFAAGKCTAFKFLFNKAKDLLSPATETEEEEN